MSQEDQDLLIEAFRRNPLFSALEIGDLRKLTDDAEHRWEDAGTTLFHQGDPAERFFLLLEGRVGLFLDREEELACVARIVRSGETFAEACICGQGVLPVTAKVLRRSSIVAIPRVNLCTLLETHPQFLLRMLSELSFRLRGLVRQITDLKMKTTAQRLATYLLTLVDQKTGPAVVHLPYEKKLLAHELGMEPETLSRALMKLQSMGVHYRMSGNVLLIDDIAVLREFCPLDEGDQ